MLRNGLVLEGKYRIEKKLDQGGMSEVYLVQHLTLGRPFALKILSKLSDLPEEQAQFAQQFQLEAKLLAGLEHPGLPHVVDLFHDATTWYLVMDLVEGITLTRMVADSLSPLHQEFVRGLAEQALDVLEYLHDCDPPIIVRDIKPDNLMITSEGRLKFIDFGLAKRLLKGDQTQTIVRGMGTDCYAPMEQYGEGVTDQRTDLYSLGATLYFTLTGEPPPPVWKRASTKEPLPDPRQLNPSVSPEFWSGLQSLLEIELKSRPAGVAEARQRLSLSAPPPGPRPDTRPLVVAHGTDYRLGSAEEFFPFKPGDWLLKAMQAATMAQAREVRVTQTRSTCKVALKIPAHALPDAGAVLDSLSGSGPPSFPWLLELACGLKMVGEFRDFRMLLENWSKAWKVDCRGGRLEANPVRAEGKAGLFLEVDYLGKSVDRARQSADEAVELTRRTRLCPFPLYLDDRRLEAERPLERPLLRGQAREVYLASISIPRDGQVQLQRNEGERPMQETVEDALADFRPGDGRPSESHLDLRAYLEPAVSATSALTGFSYVPQPVRLLWYRHGVLCTHQQLEIEQSLEVLAHMDGSHMQTDASGLNLTPGEFMFPLKLKPFTTLERILPVVRSELEAYEPVKPTRSTSVGKAAVGLVGAPLLVLLFGAVAGPIVMKSTLAAGLLQKAAALGGVAGYLHYDREDEMLRNVCIKALDAYGRKERK